MPKPGVEPTAAAFEAALREHGSTVDVARLQDHFRTDCDILGVRMGRVFALAKERVDLPPEEIERLLAVPVHEARVGAVSVMGQQYVRKQTTPGRRAELYDLYLRNLDRINTWDLVDVSAHKVIGGQLLDRPREVLYRLAASPNWWERRVAIFSTLWFIRHGQLDDTFELARLLRDDPHDLQRKVVGGMLREAGKHDRPRLLAYLDRNAAHMPRSQLTQAVQHLDPKLRAHYRGLRPALRRGGGDAERADVGGDDRVEGGRSGQARTTVASVMVMAPSVVRG